MNCRVDGCQRDARYKAARLCQMHYFRKMRTGTTDPRKKKLKLPDPRGYFTLHKPGHPLSDSIGKVWEHRYVYYEKVEKNPTNCSMCGDDISWDTLHIDHIDNDKSNNSAENLRATCRACNTYRDRPLTSGCKHVFTVNGLSMSAHAWAARSDVDVSGHTIIRRRKDFGWPDVKCIYQRRLTHMSTKTKKHSRKYDEMRIAASGGE